MLLGVGLGTANLKHLKILMVTYADYQKNRDPSRARVGLPIIEMPGGDIGECRRTTVMITAGVAVVMIIYFARGYCC